MQVQSVSNQSFGALKCEPNFSEIVMHIAKKCSADGAIQGDKYLKELKNNRAVTDLYLAGNMQKPRLYAEVGGRLFKENWFVGPLTVLKRALKVSKEQSQIDLIVDTIKILARDID